MVQILASCCKHFLLCLACFWWPLRWWRQSPFVSFTSFRWEYKKQIITQHPFFRQKIYEHGLSNSFWIWLTWSTWSNKYRIIKTATRICKWNAWQSADKFRITFGVFQEGRLIKFKHRSWEGLIQKGDSSKRELNRWYVGCWWNLLLQNNINNGTSTPIYTTKQWQYKTKQLNYTGKKTQSKNTT